MENQKKEYLEKYLPKKASKAQSNKPQLQVFDPEMDLPDHSSSEDEVPLLYNPSGLVLSEIEARTLLKKGVLDPDLLKNIAKPTEEIPKKVLFSIITLFIPPLEHFRDVGPHHGPPAKDQR